MSSNSEALCFAGCGEIGTLRCSRCLVALYCGKICQTNAWPQHKGPCKEVVKARAAVEEAVAREEADDNATAAAAATATSSVTLCAMGCEIATLRCPRCLGAWYCSKECGKIAWPKHKGPCNEAARVLGGQPIAEFGF